MTARHEPDERSALFDEAVAMYEAARAEFDALQQVFQDSLRTGKALTPAENMEEERVRARLFFARVRLSKRTGSPH